MDQLLPPTLVIGHGQHRVEIFDPRPNPSALGARYVHGGYIAAWWHAQVCLTARPQTHWDPYLGQGLPEVFEYPVGRDSVAVGEEFLRVGAGRLRKDQGHWPQAGGLPSTPVTWELTQHTTDQLSMQCADHLGPFGYELCRTVQVHPDGITSHTRLTLQCPWSQPIYWFAHPFFAQPEAHRTQLHLPAHAQAHFQLGPEGGFGPVTNLWGYQQPLPLTLANGASLELSLDRSLDKLVVYATRCAFSVEPYLCRAWHAGETAHWTLRYRLTRPPQL